MKPIIDLREMQFGEWTVTSLSHRREGTAILWWCECSCGTKREVLGNSLRRGASTNCGCEKYRLHAKRQTKHGHSTRKAPTRAYHVWKHIMQRCYNPNSKDYKYYGGRGINVCSRWFKFENFFRDMGDPPKGLTIDRIKNDGDYEPGNCRWATRAQQTENRRPITTGHFAKGNVLNRGERAASAKLTLPQAREIKELRGKKSQKNIAAQYGVSQSLVCMIQTGTIWPELR